MQTFSQDFISDPDILKQLLILKTDILILGTNLVQKYLPRYSVVSAPQRAGP